MKEYKELISPTPDTLFLRFLQRKAKIPTEVQLHTWENDGGTIIEQDFIIINGTICRTFFQRIRAYIIKFWRILKIYIAGHQSLLSN